MRVHATYENKPKLKLDRLLRLCGLCAGLYALCVHNGKKKKKKNRASAIFSRCAQLLRCELYVMKNTPPPPQKKKKLGLATTDAQVQRKLSTARCALRVAQVGVASFINQFKKEREHQDRPKTKRNNTPRAEARARHHRRAGEQKARTLCHNRPKTKRNHEDVSQRSRSNSSPFEKTRSKLANPVELSWAFDRFRPGLLVLTGICRLVCLRPG